MSALSAAPRTVADFALWGGRASIAVTEPGQLQPAMRLVSEELGRIERAASTYRADSELVRINRGDTAAQLSPLLAEMVAVSLRVARATGGLVDPTVTHPGTGTWRDVFLDGPMLVRGGGVRLDLGATAKAWAADRCATLVHQALGTGVLVGLLGDLSAAGPAPELGWRIDVAEDHRSQDDTVSIRIGSGGVATSSTTTRRHRDAGRSVVVTGVPPCSNHIVDPLTRRSVTGRWRTVSVAADSCVGANAASTAALVLGNRAALWGVSTLHTEESVEWLLDRGLSARLIDAEGQITTVGGWPR
ncbi:MAG: FAD:protein FMN transferase [Actinobacteria bacterium]|nr:FAD:protein FMN transferase [Actinomycetota bacterium]